MISYNLTIGDVVIDLELQRQYRNYTRFSKLVHALEILGYGYTQLLLNSAAVSLM
jgi:hypothetical protein